MGLKSSVLSSPHELLVPTRGLNCPSHLHLPFHPSPHLCPLPFVGISQILRLVLQELNLFYSRDVNGVCLLYDLLHSPWLQALLKVSAPFLRSLSLGSRTYSSNSVACQLAGNFNWEKVQRRATQPLSLGRNILGWKRIWQLLSFLPPTPFLPETPEVTQQPPQTAIDSTLSSCLQPFVLEANSGQIKML